MTKGIQKPICPPWAVMDFASPLRVNNCIWSRYYIEGPLVVWCDFFSSIVKEQFGKQFMLVEILSSHCPTFIDPPDSSVVHHCNHPIRGTRWVSWKAGKATKAAAVGLETLCGPVGSLWWHCAFSCILSVLGTDTWYWVPRTLDLFIHILPKIAQLQMGQIANSHGSCRSKEGQKCALWGTSIFHLGPSSSTLHCWSECKRHHIGKDQEEAIIDCVSYSQ